MGNEQVNKPDSTSGKPLAWPLKIAQKEIEKTVARSKSQNEPLTTNRESFAEAVDKATIRSQAQGSKPSIFQRILNWFK